MSDDIGDAALFWRRHDAVRAATRMFGPIYDISIPMAHCGICNSSYPAHHYHQCCGQRPLPTPIVPALEALGEICRLLGALDRADRNWLIDRLNAMNAEPSAPAMGDKEGA